jgi:AmiR/NasT family two-component response regulator
MEDKKRIEAMKGIIMHRHGLEARDTNLAR